MTDTIKFLRKELKNKVDEGTVVTFNRTLTSHWDPMSNREYTVNPLEGKVYMYAALFVDDRWFLTGKGRLGNESLTTRDFLDRLSQSDISDVRVATAFEAL